MSTYSRYRNFTTVEVYRNLTLPILLLEEIQDLAFSKSEFNKALHVIYLLSPRTGSFDNQNYYQYQPLTSSFLKQKLGTNYEKVINPQKENGIIECDNIFYKGKGFHYRVNPLYTIDNEVVNVKFKYKSKIPLSVYHQNKRYLEYFVSDISKLEIPFDKLYAAVDRKIESISLADYRTDLETRWEGVREVNFTDYDSLFEMKPRLKFEDAMRKVRAEGRRLIQVKNRIFGLYESDFLTLKKTNVHHAYLSAIENLKEENTLYAQRNKTNNRLDTNITTLPKALTEIIYTENRIVEFDLKNSQPALLAYLMEKEGVQGADVVEYCRSAYDGGFYELMMKHTGLTREQCKQMIFEVLFSSGRLNSKDKRRFKELFPSVWDYTVDYKKRNGNNSLAIRLQKLESNIFIDNIYLPLKNNGIFLLTKHDSVACKMADAPMVEDYINGYFQTIGFKGKIEFEDSDKIEPTLEEVA